MEFSVLGPVEVTAGVRPLGLGGARARAVLAILLAHANQVVPADRLTDELWPGHPADKAAASLQVRLSELRRAFRSAGEADRLATRPPGYLLTVAPAEADWLRFAQLAEAGNAALAAGDVATAARRLGDALALWRGAAFAGIDVSSVRARPAAWRRCASRRWSRGRRRCWPAAGTPNSSRNWRPSPPPTRCASGSGPPGCLLCIAAVRRTRCAPTGTCARSWTPSWGSSRARRCATCTRASCARTQRSTVRARRAAGGRPRRRGPAMSRPPTASTSRTRCSGTVIATSSSCPA